MRTAMLGVIGLCALSVAGCDDVTPVWVADQELRVQLFERCLFLSGNALRNLNTLNTGHDAKMGDMIEECSDATYYQSRYCIKNCPDGNPKGRPLALIERTKGMPIDINAALMDDTGLEP